MEVSAHLLGMQRHPVHLLEQGANPERMNVIDMHTVVSPSSALEVLSLPLLMCSCGWRVQEKPTVASSPPQTVPLQRTFLLAFPLAPLLLNKNNFASMCGTNWWEHQVGKIW